MTKRTVSVPLTIIDLHGDGFHPVLDIVVFNKPFKVVLDTGASRTAFDHELLVQANEEAAIVASDKVVRDFALTRGLKALSILWIIEELVHASLLSKNDAAKKLKTLAQSNLHYQNNSLIRSEMADHLKRWITTDS